MCISDWRLGRFLRTAQQQQTVGIGATVTISANSNRVGLVIAAPPTGTIITANLLIQFNGVTVGVLAPNVLQEEFWFPQYGDLLRQSFSMTATSNAFSVGITEFILPESVLAEHLEKFYSGAYQ